MMNDMEIKLQISAYIDGELSQQERELVEDLLIKDPIWQAYYKELTQLSSELKVWNDEDLSPDSEQTMMKKLQARQQQEDIKMKASTFKKATFGGGIFVTILLAFIVGRFSHTYMKESIQGRLRSATDDIGDQFDPSLRGSVISKTQAVAIPKTEVAQYEPYYLDTTYSAKKDKSVVHQQTAQLAMKQEVKNSANKNIQTVELGQTFWGDAEGGRAEEKISSQPMAAKAKYDVNSAMAVSNGMTTASDEKRVKGSVSKSLMETEVDVIGSIMPSPRVINVPDEQQVWDYQQTNNEDYARINENQFLKVTDNPLSTFSIDVDTAAYSNVRRFLQNNQMPPEDAVRIEEMINYFSYNYPEPEKGKPFSITTNGAVCPWNEKHQIIQIGLHGKTFEAEEVPPSNLVFLIDVSGSMGQPNKLPLLKSAYKMMVNQLTDNERVAIVVYAGAAGKVLDSTPGSDKRTILEAIDRLSSGGSTAGGAGIQLAYKIAKENFIKGGNNRVILATDGDFNVGANSNSEMTRLIEEKRDEGVFLTVLGFGMGNYKDAKMESIANKGNGNYYYIDNLKEAKKVLVQELGSTLFTIAKDVKLQIEFNPNKVKAYRLIGYENRMLAKEDFNDDTKDAGELGAGHTVTALYEIVPTDSEEEFGDVDALVYQKKTVNESEDLMNVKLRYKKPAEDKSQLIQQAINSSEITTKPKGDFQFVAAVAEFGLLLRNSQFKANASYQEALKAAKQSKGSDEYGYRQELIDLIETADSLDSRPTGNGIRFK